MNDDRSHRDGRRAVHRDLRALRPFDAPKTPDGGGAAVGGDGALTAGEAGSQQDLARCRWGTSHPVDAAVDGHEEASGHPGLHLAGGEPGGKGLRAGYQAMLLRSQPGDLHVARVHARQSTLRV